MSRVDASRIAARKAQDAADEAKLPYPMTKGSVVASDAFFPFADGLLVAIEAGATIGPVALDPRSGRRASIGRTMPYAWLNTRRPASSGIDAHRPRIEPGPACTLP